jgi:hypothetical protein
MVDERRCVLVLQMALMLIVLLALDLLCPIPSWYPASVSNSALNPVQARGARARRRGPVHYVLEEISPSSAPATSLIINSDDPWPST